MANAPFDTFPAFSFGGLKFPYSTYSIAGGIRKHDHEYPHNPGAAVEKLGRKLYEIRVSVNFTSGLTDPRYQSLLAILANLRASFEAQTTDDLVIPHIGTIQACAEHWTESARSNNRSTIQAELTFFEDLNSALQIRNQVDISAGSIQSLSQALVTLTKPLPVVYADNGFRIKQIGPNSTSLWDAINDLSVTIAGIQDQSDLYGALVASKIAGLIALLRQADQSVESLNSSDNWPVLDALHALWDVCLTVQADLQNTGFQAQLYGVPARMSIADVSFAIYGNTLAAGQLMQLNELPNPLAIETGTTILYYPGLQA